MCRLIKSSGGDSRTLKPVTDIAEFDSKLAEIARDFEIDTRECTSHTELGGERKRPKLTDLEGGLRAELPGGRCAQPGFDTEDSPSISGSTDFGCSPVGG